MFLMYYVIRFLGKLVAKITNALLDAICKLIDFVTPFAKNIYYLLLGIICILFSLGGLLLKFPTLCEWPKYLIFSLSHITLPP